LTVAVQLHNLQFMENIITPCAVARAIVVIPALVALSAGKVIALPLSALIDVLVDEGRTGSGRVRYVGADGFVAVHFGCDPLDHVWEFTADRIRAVRGGLALQSLIALLASRPPVACELGTDGLVVHSIAV
jgi:hypothetical protein